MLLASSVEEWEVNARKGDWSQTVGGFILQAEDPFRCFECIQFYFSTMNLIVLQNTGFLFYTNLKIITIEYSIPVLYNFKKQLLLNTGFLFYT